MPDAQEVPHEEPDEKAGYTYDPYSDPCQLSDIHSPNIPFHTYRQIHVSEVAWGEGIRAISIRALPPCQPKWGDVAHYWYMVSFGGYLFQEFCSSQLWVKIISAPVIVFAINWGLNMLGFHTGI